MCRLEYVFNQISVAANWMLGITSTMVSFKVCSPKVDITDLGVADFVLDAPGSPFARLSSTPFLLPG